MLIKIHPDATVCKYLFTVKSLYMFRVSQHPSSGVLKTVTAASGTVMILVQLLPSTAACRRLFIQYIRSYPPYRRPFLYPQPEDAPCRGDRDPLHGLQLIIIIIIIIIILIVAQHVSGNHVPLIRS
jgi:hypothetical protein